MAVVQSWKYVSLSFAGQTDLTTLSPTSADYTKFACEVAMPKPARVTQAIDYATGAPGTSLPPVTGARQGGELSIKFPLTKLRTGYDHTTQRPGGAGPITSPALVLLANALGSKNASVSSNAANFKLGLGQWFETYDAGAVISGSDTETVKLDTGLGAGIVPGSLLAVGNGTDLSQLGWVRNVSTDDVNLVEDWTGAAANGDAIWPSATCAMNGAEQIPLSFKVFGKEASFVDVAIGAVCKSIKISAKAGEVPIVEMTYGIFGDLYRASTGGGVNVPSNDWAVLPPLTGLSGARLTFDGSALCGAEDLEISIELDIQPRACHGSRQGVGAVDTVQRTAEVSLKLPRMSDDSITTSGDGPYQNAFVGRDTHVMAIYVGDTPGSIFSLLFFCSIVEEPTNEDVGGRFYHGLKLRSAPLTSMGNGTIAETAPQNSSLLLGAA